MAACSDKSVTGKKKMIDVGTIKDLKKLKAEVLHLNIHIHVCTGANGSKLTKNISQKNKSKISSSGNRTRVPNLELQQNRSIAEPIANLNS